MKHVTQVGAPSRALLYTEPGRASIEFGTYLVSAPLLRRAPHGDGHTVHSKAIEHTDFPLPEIALYFVDGTIMLPSEY